MRLESSGSVSMTAAMEIQHEVTSMADGLGSFARCWNGARNLSRFEQRPRNDRCDGAALSATICSREPWG